jgi:hypothetical protein
MRERGNQKHDFAGIDKIFNVGKEKKDKINEKTQPKRLDIASIIEPVVVKPTSLTKGDFHDQGDAK